MLLQNSNHDAFREIYRRYWDKLFYLAAKKLKSPEEAECLVQDVFVDIWQRRQQLNVREALDGYLVVAVKYRIINVMAKRDRARTWQQHTSNTSAPAEWLKYHELKDWLDKTVARLPEKCRIVYQLKSAGYSQKEIARQMQVSEKTVETHISRALKVLRTGFNHLLFMLLFICRF
ncbi:DNA-directed RNA polymerase sigma-70 factor [Filimonas zeae]|uniref:DNA-directed RNA polymerase sigma-70 factor n=1 Tax=Filimonas zeae TaxID=1737353 RepID=A0A917IX15_9BACT|nr:DNA-directed RNA polymerase sigma-70 factor [Filimonas zeae]